MHLKQYLCKPKIHLSFETPSAVKRSIETSYLLELIVTVLQHLCLSRIEFRHEPNDLNPIASEFSKLRLNYVNPNALQDDSIAIAIWAASWQNQENDCAPSEDLDQPGYPPSLIRVFAVRSMGSWGTKLSSCWQRRLWSDWADTQADLSLRSAHSHCWFCHEAAHFCCLGKIVWLCASKSISFWICREFWHL